MTEGYALIAASGWLCALVIFYCFIRLIEALGVIREGLDHMLSMMEGAPIKDD